jgi:hypothetical protein
LAPALAGSGASTFVVASSAVLCVVVVVVAELLVVLGSTMSDDAVAVSVIVEPVAVEDATCTTSVKFATLEAAIEPLSMVQVTVPEALAHVQPDPIMETKVVPVGTASVSFAFVAATVALLLVTAIA